MTEKHKYWFEIADKFSEWENLQTQNPQIMGLDYIFFCVCVAVLGFKLTHPKLVFYNLSHASSISLF
jgi:hypothetical protein